MEVATAISKLLCLVGAAISLMELIQYKHTVFPLHKFPASQWAYRRNRNVHICRYGLYAETGPCANYNTVSFVFYNFIPVFLYSKLWVYQSVNRRTKIGQSCIIRQMIIGTRKYHWLKSWWQIYCEMYFYVRKSNDKLSTLISFENFKIELPN